MVPLDTFVPAQGPQGWHNNGSLAYEHSNVGPAATASLGGLAVLQKSGGGKKKLRSHVVETARNNEAKVSSPKSKLWGTSGSFNGAGAFPRWLARLIQRALCQIRLSGLLVSA